MNCKNCGAPMMFDHEKIYFSCDYCTSIFHPEESREGILVTDEESKYTCPICHIPLFTSYAGKIKLLTCGKCRGVLVDQVMFMLLIEYIRSKTGGEPVNPPPVRLEELKREIDCPKCKRRMDTHPYAGPGNVVIDNCPRCMVNWMDPNELFRIARSPDRLKWAPEMQKDYERLFSRKKKSPK